MNQFTKLDRALMIIGIIVLSILAVLLATNLFNAQVDGRIDHYFNENGVWYRLDQIY